MKQISHYVGQSPPLDGDLQIDMQLEGCLVFIVSTKLLLLS